MRIYTSKYMHIEDRATRKRMTNVDRQLRCRYGISLEDRNKMEAEQNGLCKVCGEKKRLVVEHNHETGKIRGLTCDGCNTLIGQLEKLTPKLFNDVLLYLYTDGDMKCE